MNIDTLVRDLCSVECRTKSQTRKLVKNFIEQAVEEEREKIAKDVGAVLDTYVVKKEPLGERDALILSIRISLLAFLDEPVTDN